MTITAVKKVDQYLEITEDGKTRRMSVDWADCIVSAIMTGKLKVLNIYRNTADDLFYADYLDANGVQQTVQLGGGGSVSELSDVDLTGLADGYILYYDSASGTWKVEEDCAYKIVDGVYVDSVNGVAGTTGSIGTPQNPVSNLTDALTIAAAIKLKKLYLVNPSDSFTLTANLEGFEVIGTTAHAGFGVLIVADWSIDKSIFRGLFVKALDECYADNGCTFVDCKINLYIDGNATFKNCQIFDLVQTGNAHYIDLIACWARPIDVTVLSCGGALQNNININGFDGWLVVEDVGNVATTVDICCRGGIKIEDTCGPGTITIRGECNVENYGTADVFDYRIGQHNARFFQETVAATDVNGVTWEDLLDRSTITSPVRICGFTVTKGGSWAGSAKIRVTDGAGNKIIPFGAELVETTDFTSGTQVVFNFPVEVSVSKGYIVQFRSSNAGDGAGETLALSLDVEELS